MQIDRKNNYYFLNIGLPLPGLKRTHRNTILDGELVFESNSKKQELLYLAFDALVVDEKLLINRKYTVRLGVLI
jgi:mRNA guanylyltransferase